MMVRKFICFSLILISILSNGFVEGRSSNLKKLAKHEGSLKTIEIENGDIIDCVDIYKQPAFSHPLLKNHTIQIKPSSYPKNSLENNSTVDALNDLLQEFNCPEGTIPISRTQINIPRRRPIHFDPMKHPKISFTNHPSTHEYAIVSMFGDINGAEGNLNIWNPATFDNEISIAQIWITAGQGDVSNTIEAGWMVDADDNQPRLFIYWTRDHYKKTGCYNLQCPGFIQTNRKYTIGSHFTPVSKYGGKQFQIFIKMFKDVRSGNWWLQVQNQVLGYWPKAIFTTLAGSADTASWGGEITNHLTHGRHTSTKMGSGHFPNEGFGKASYIRRLRYIDTTNVVRDPLPISLRPYVSKSLCYGLQFRFNSPRYLGTGTHFFYGGSGFSKQCLR